jgi:hypothetical protein
MADKSVWRKECFQFDSLRSPRLGRMVTKSMHSVYWSADDLLSTRASCAIHRDWLPSVFTVVPS